MVPDSAAIMRRPRNGGLRKSLGRVPAAAHKVIRRDLALGCGNDLLEVTNWKCLASFPAVHRHTVYADFRRKMLAVNLVALQIIREFHAA